ncbi:MAG TPA: MBL fold metallo-hydrolase [Ktedonobacteraceae bacterium]|jgi:glyoxylase-like metal-dependent hydrolase (beta-lactamase superfamily II)|nr:MBL fold metallo-hydrolase [Ktedonobacteraceae bacterium]
MSSVPVCLQCHILDTGYCIAWEHHLMQGGQRRKIGCHSLVALLYHPQQGWLLWDTGYAPRILTATQRLPFLLYRYATPLRLRPELSVVAQLARWNLQPGDIRRVILSHFHADHIAGLRDFPQAEIIASEAAYEDIAWRHGLRALQRAFIPALLPKDFDKRVRLLSTFAGPVLPALGQAHDLFGDGSLLLMELPGHARGQMGLLAQTTRGQMLFAADGCWLRRSIRERRPPARITHLFVDNTRAVQSTINHLHDFSQACPDVVIIPSHCPEAFAEEVEPGE